MLMRAGFAIVVLGLSGVVAVAAAPPSPPAKPRPPKERRLHVANAEASSYLINDWNKFQENYLPLYVGDDDPRTAWSLKTEGIGEWLRVHVTPMEGATKLRMKIRNGYQKTPRLWEANSRAKELTVTLLPSKKTVDVTLEDKSDWQEITLEQPAGAFEAVELKVKSVYAGKKYDDLCISDVQMFVTATSSDNPAFEKQRFDKIATWKKERVAAAKMFKTKLGQSLPIAPQYVATPVDDAEKQMAALIKNPCKEEHYDPTCEMGHAVALATKGAGKGKHAAALATAGDLARAKFAGMTGVRVSVRDKRPLPTVDGLCTPNLASCEDDPCANALPLPMTNQLGYLDREALALVEQTGLPTFADAMATKPPQCHHHEATTFAWALRDAPAATPDAGAAPPPLRALLLVSCGLVEGREGSFPSSTPQLLVYGADGRLEVTVGVTKAAALEWDRGQDGPKLARATVWRDNDWVQLDVEAVAGVVARK
ncbi:MAG TPA: hypothetical protein VIQ54_03900 [Polyangia bacterium]